VTPVKLLLVEDNDSFRETLELLLSLRSDVEVVGSLADGARAVEACRELAPDVVVLDYRLPGLDSVDVARTLRENCSEVAVVCLTGSVTEGEVAELRSIGVAATLMKDAPLDAIVDVLHRAAGRIAV
jgi:DNA-binding NarL/FixJ family response regulator